jgi:hypothetical protein
MSIINQIWRPMKKCWCSERLAIYERGTVQCRMGFLNTTPGANLRNGNSLRD